jgi:hypothetical protein
MSAVRAGHFSPLCFQNLTIQTGDGKQNYHSVHMERISMSLNYTIAQVLSITFFKKSISRIACFALPKEIKTAQYPLNC